MEFKHGVFLDLVSINIIEGKLHIVKSLNIILQNITVTPYNTVMDGEILEIERKTVMNVCYHYKKVGSHRAL